MTRYCGKCFAPRIKRDPTRCENYHTWDEAASVGPREVLAAKEARLAEVRRQLAEIPQWGAAVSVLGSEERGLVSSINYWKDEVKKEET